MHLWMFQLRIRSFTVAKDNPCPCPCPCPCPIWGTVRPMRAPTRLGLLAALALVAWQSAPALAQPAADRLPEPPPAADPKIPFETYALPNGLQVILAPDSTVPLVV